MTKMLVKKARYNTIHSVILILDEKTYMYTYKYQNYAHTHMHINTEPLKTTKKDKHAKC